MVPRLSLPAMTSALSILGSGLSTIAVLNTSHLPSTSDGSNKPLAESSRIKAESADPTMILVADPDIVVFEVAFNRDGLEPVICSRSVAKLFNAMCMPTKSFASATMLAPAILIDAFVDGEKVTNFSSRSAWVVRSHSAQQHNPIFVIRMMPEAVEVRLH